MTSGDQERQARRARAARRAAQRRHPSHGGTQPGQLRLTAGQPARQAPAPPANTTKETTMPDHQDPPADHRDQLGALLAQAVDLAAALDDIEPDDKARLLDIARQMVPWHAKLATVLLGIVGTPAAERGVTLAAAVSAVAEAQPRAIPSAFEVAARMFDLEDGADA